MAEMKRLDKHYYDDYYDDVKLKCECRLCGHKWERRVPKLPLCCPRCKRYDWNSSGSERIRPALKVIREIGSGALDGKRGK